MSMNATMNATVVTIETTNCGHIPNPSSVNNFDIPKLVMQVLNSVNAIVFKSKAIKLPVV